MCRCYLDPPDSEPISLLEDHYKSHGIQWVWKPNTNILEAPGFAQWLEAHLQNGVRTLIVGGCTTTSCVRVSSQAVQRQYGDQGLQVHPTSPTLAHPSAFQIFMICIL